MGAAFFRAGTDMRRRLRSALLLTLAIGIAGGVTLAALAGARRTNTAVDRFLAYDHPAEGYVQANPALYPRIARLPQVAASSNLARFALRRIDDANHLISNDALGTVGVGNLHLSSPIIVSGRLPRSDRADEIAINVSAARNERLGVGTKLRFKAYAPAQRNALFCGSLVQPTGPVFAGRVVGVVRFPADLSTAQLSPDVLYTGQDTAYFTPEFLRANGDRIATFGGVLLGYRLNSGTAAGSTFPVSVARISRGKAEIFTNSDDLDGARRARHATSVEALALLLFGVLAGVVTLTLIAQSFARQVYLDSNEYRTLRAIGMTRRQLVVASTLRAALISVVGGSLAVGLAILVSPRMPIGLARQAEVNRGYSVDGLILFAGIGAIALILTSWTAWITWRATRFAGVTATPGTTGGRSSRIARSLGQAGAPPSTALGARMAFEPGRGASAVPVRTAMASAVIAVAVVAGALTFGANLTRLAEHPDLQGWNWSVAVGNPHAPDDMTKTAVPLLERNPNVDSYSAIAGAEAVPARIDGHDAAVFGIDVVKGQQLVPYTAGRAPVRDNEIALGSKTLSDLHRAIGQHVRVSAGGPAQSMLVTGRIVLNPSIVNDSVELGQGAVVTKRGLHALHADAPVTEMLVRFEPNVDRSATLRGLRADFPGTVLSAVRPPDIENLRRVDHLPGLLAGLFALIALLTVGNTLVNSVRRRRGELAVLRTMGLLRRQVSAIVAWQATMVALVAIVVGVPAGAAAGRATWTLVTDRLGLPEHAIFPIATLFLVAAGAIVAANLIAVIPGVLATRTPPATILHSE